MRRLLSIFSVGLLGAVTAAAALAAPTATKVDVSSNWSGYSVTGPGSTTTTASNAMSFTNVTATWTQPAANCAPGETNSAAMWVGLGGYSENAPALEQTGTEADCTNGVPSYSVWYELLPADSVPVKLKLFAGDVVTASVLVTGTDVLVQVKNRTRHTVFTKHLPMAAPDLSSAEWIAEAPSLCDSRTAQCRTTSLANFGSVTFSKVAATGNGLGGRLNNPGWVLTPIQLVPDARSRFFGRPNAFGVSSAGATPAPISTDGSAFAVNWVADATAGQ